MISAFLTDEYERKVIEEIYNEYEHLCYHIALKMTRNAATAQDVVHETFVAVIRHKDEFIQLREGDLTRKIVCLVRNKSIDALRVAKRISFSNIDDMREILKADLPPMDYGLMLQETYGMLLERIADLDEVSRSIFEMKYVQHMTYKQIAKQLGIPVKTVDTKIVRAKQQIRTTLRELNYDE